MEAAVPTTEAPLQSQSRQRLFQPPLRLNWPSSSSSSLLQQHPTKRLRPNEMKHIPIHTLKKRSRPLSTNSSSTIGSVSMNEGSNNNVNDLWTVRHIPQSVGDLVVATKKVQEIRNWMKSHTNHHGRYLSQETTSSHCTYPSPPPMLILVGSPGIGKSTCIRCLAVELELEVSEWTESFATNSNYEDGYSKHCNPIDSFEQFLQQCGSDISPLTMQSSISHSSSLPTSRNSHCYKKVIVVDELPYTHSMDAQERLQQIITTHIRRPNVVPTIFIHSDTAEGKVRYDDLERYIHPHTLYESSLCQIISINPPTKAKFRQVMHKIIVSERTTMKRNTSVPSTNTYLEELYERCHGDLRFAITTLQFEIIGDSMVHNHTKYTNAHSSRHMSSQQLVTNRTTKHRDSKLSPFHALGKLLYAKREVETPPSHQQHLPILL